VDLDRLHNVGDLGAPAQQNIGLTQLGDDLVVRMRPTLPEDVSPS
jgi:hypothetical protein